MSSQMTTQNNYLPVNIEDLAKFVLIGREKLISVKAEIRAMGSLTIAKEVLDQKKEEAQDLAELLIDAEIKIGELTKTMDKLKNQYDANRTDATSKTEQLKKLGFTKDDASRFEQLANNPGLVEKAKSDAKKRGEVVNRTQILKQVQAEQRKNKTQEMINTENNKMLPVNIKLLEGDIFDKIKEIPDSSIDLLCTDPPYFVLNENWDEFENKMVFLKFTSDWLQAVIPKVKKTGRVYISFAFDYMYDLYNILLEHNFFGFEFYGSIIWVKKNTQKPFNRKGYQLTYEPILYLYGKSAKILNFTEYGEIQGNVWEIATPQSNFKEGKYHPAQKPRELYRRIISTGSEVNDTILDCFAGSGTTGLVCKMLNRNCILIERDVNYINLIKNRVGD